MSWCACVVANVVLLTRCGQLLAAAWCGLAAGAMHQYALLHGATHGAKRRTAAQAELLVPHSLHNMLPGLCSNLWGGTQLLQHPHGGDAYARVLARAGLWRWWAPSFWRAATWDCTAVRQGSWSPALCWCASSHC